jgi:cytoskeletal protein RodZ
MARFSRHTIQEPTHAGELLQRIREERHLSLHTVERETKLPLKYLEIIEAGDWELLPKGDYSRYFVREYAKYLGLDPAPFLSDVSSVAPNLVTQRAKRPVNVIRAVHPMRRLMVAGVLVLVLTYLAFAARVILRPPELTLVSPETDVTTTQPMLVVSGRTTTGTEVTLNGSLVQVNERGRFSQEVPLQPGLNTLTVVGKKGLSRPITIVRRVLFTPVVGNQENTAPVPRP